MSVLIKGAKPPSGCRWCYFNDDSKCVLIAGCDYDDTNGTNRRKDCPLIELPDHGDLIERDTLMTSLGMAMDCEDCPNRTQFFFCGLSTEMAEVCDKLENAPVIIPAERSEE